MTRASYFQRKSEREDELAETVTAELRLTAAREGVVKALRTFAREVEFLREQGELMGDDDRIGRPLSATKSATRLVLANLLAARDALKELEEASK